MKAIVKEAIIPRVGLFKAEEPPYDSPPAASPTPSPPRLGGSHNHSRPMY
jgi:hypothetical protein